MKNMEQIYNCQPFFNLRLKQKNDEKNIIENDSIRIFFLTMTTLIYKSLKMVKRQRKFCAQRSIYGF